MSATVSVKIRLVRCPKCRHILPEYPDVPVYECGGCGTRLQAKVRKSNAISTTSDLHYPDSAQIKKLDGNSGDQESNSSSHGVILHSSGECSLDQNNGGNQLVSGNFNSDHTTAVGLQDEDRDNGCDQNNSGVSEQLVGLNPSNEEQNNEGGKYVSGDFDSEQLGNASLFNGDKNNGSDQNKSPDCDFEQPAVGSEVCSSGELAVKKNEELSLRVRADSAAEVVDHCSSLTEEIAVDTKTESDHKFRSSTENMVDTKETLSNITRHRPAGESISSDIFISSPNEQLEQTLESAEHGFIHVTSTDTSETTDFVNPSSELSGTLIDLSKSPTTTSARAYYDDGASSYEGMDDQSPGRYKHPFKGANKPSYYAAFDERPKREKFLANRDSEIEHQLKNVSPLLHDKTRHAMKSSKLDQSDVLEPTRPAHSARDRRRSEREYASHQRPFYRSGFQTGYETGRPSVDSQNEFHCDTNFHLRDTPAYGEQEKIKLLRMVYELQDQLKKTCALNEKPNGRLSAGVTWKDPHHMPMHYDHEGIEEDNFCNYSRYPGRFRERGNEAHCSKYSRIPFSAEATNGIYQVDHSMCCCPQDWQYLAKLPPPGVHRSKGLCKVHAGINFCNSYSSCPSSPQWNMNSEFPIYGHATRSDDQRQRENGVRKFLREKHYSGKRYLRPIAGGAPFITCPRCLKQLQLPADFVHGKKRCYRLQCGVCLELLRFSLLNGHHLVPYTATVKAPPPSEVDDYFEAVNGRDLASTSHAYNCRHAEPVSCSDDFGHSWCKSCSTDLDPVSQESFHGIQGNAVNRKVTSSPLEHGESRKKFSSHESQKKLKNPVKTYESAGPSSTMSKIKTISSEIEELPAEGSSPLHLLMGYSSARDVMYGYGPFGSGTL